MFILVDRLNGPWNEACLFEPDNTTETTPRKVDIIHTTHGQERFLSSGFFLKGKTSLSGCLLKSLGTLFSFPRTVCQPENDRVATLTSSVQQKKIFALPT